MCPASVVLGILLLQFDISSHRDHPGMATEAPNGDAQLKWKFRKQIEHLKGRCDSGKERSAPHDGRIENDST